MRYTPEMQAIYDDWERRVKHPAWEAGWKAGEEAGRQAGEEATRKAADEATRKAADEAARKTVRENLRQVYQARFGALPPAVQAAIESMEDIDTLQHWVVPFATAAPEELASLVRDR